jgi:hypothetical protein
VGAQSNPLEFFSTGSICSIIHIFRALLHVQFVKHHFEQPHLTAAKCLHYIGSLSQHMYSDQIFDRVNHTYLLQIMFIIPQKHKFKLLHLSHNTTSTVKSSTSDESSCRRDQHASLYSITALMKSTHIA